MITGLVFWLALALGFWVRGTKAGVWIVKSFSKAEE